MEKEEIEQIVDKKFRKIIAEEKNGSGNNNNNRNKASNHENKNQKSRSKDNWKTECIKEGGSEMVEFSNSTQQSSIQQSRRRK